MAFESCKDTETAFAFKCISVTLFSLTLIYCGPSGTLPPPTEDDPDHGNHLRKETDRFEGRRVPHLSGDKAHFDNLTCLDMLLKNNACKKFSFQKTMPAGPWVDQARCYFKNHVSAYALQRGHELFLDIKGLSGGEFTHSNPDVDHVEQFNDCREIEERLYELQAMNRHSFPEAPLTSMRSRDGVTLVASESTCSRYETEFSRFHQLMTAEGRERGKTVCIPSSVIHTKKPHEIKRSMERSGISTRGILIVGTDIPPFELHTQERGMKWTAQSDLPYGQQSNVFWDSPISKQDPRLLNIFYFSKGLFRTDYPSIVSYDMTAYQGLLKSKRIGFEQKHWVTRWFSYKGPEAFNAFLNRRASYRPTDRPNIVAALGGQALFYQPGKNAAWGYYWKLFLEALKALGVIKGLVLVDASLDGVLRNLDPHTTFVHVFEHANSGSVGDASAETFRNARSIPPVMDLSGCLTGSWSINDQPERETLIGSAFSRLQDPALIIRASQSMSSFPTFQGEDSAVVDIYWHGLRRRQTLGNRQVETLHNNMRTWQEKNFKGPVGQEIDGLLILQALSGLSLFGDGTIEL